MSFASPTRPFLKIVSTLSLLSLRVASISRRYGTALARGTLLSFSIGHLGINQPLTIEDMKQVPLKTCHTHTHTLQLTIL